MWGMGTGISMEWCATGCSERCRGHNEGCIEGGSGRNSGVQGMAVNGAGVQ